MLHVVRSIYAADAVTVGPRNTQEQMLKNIQEYICLSAVNFHSIVILTHRPVERIVIIFDGKI